MSKVWILDTETKGTGANLVPLEDRSAPTPAPRGISPPQPRRKPAEPAPLGPRRFRVIDVLSREVLADDVDTSGALEALRGVRSVVDVEVEVWEELSERWRPLRIGERKGLWRLRERGSG